MPTAEEINTRVSDAVTAIDAGEYDTALRKLEGAAILLAAIPDQSAQQTELRFDRRAIENMIDRVRQLASANRGEQRSNVIYERPQWTPSGSS